MPSRDLSELSVAVNQAFALDTCSPDDVPYWSEDNRSRGHCAVATLVLHDYLGGQLLRAEVHEHGERIGYHWWNRLPDRDVDLTGDQFRPTERVGEPAVIDRPAGPPGNYAEQYDRFKARVEAFLDLTPPPRCPGGGVR